MPSPDSNRGSEIALPQRTLSKLTQAPALSGALQVKCSRQIRAATGTLVDQSPDLCTNLLSSKGGSRTFVTDDPSHSYHIKRPPPGVSFICGDGYRGIAFSNREIFPWIVNRKRLVVGAPLRGAWQDAWTTGGLSYFARDGQTLRRLLMSPDGASLTSVWDTPSPIHASKVQEIPGRDTLLFELPQQRTSVVAMQDLSPGSTSVGRASAWSFRSSFGARDSTRLAVSDGTFSLWEISPPERDQLGARISVVKWTMGEQDHLEQNSITFPSSMPYASAALSPRCNLIAAIGDLSDGLGVRYFLHLYALPSFSLITSQVFENNIDSPATVEFSADGGALVVRDEQMLHSWAVGDNPHDGIRKIGVYRSPNGIAGRCATSAHVFLTQESDPDLGEVVTYTWLALSPKAEIRPLDLANYDLVTGF